MATIKNKDIYDAVIYGLDVLNSVTKNEINREYDAGMVHDWRLVDDSNPKFNVWESIWGYCECFRKGMNPNIRRNDPIFRGGNSENE
jgi:hypothetical protein